MAEPNIVRSVVGLRSPLPARSALAWHWGLDPDIVFLNHGSFGACPRVVLEKQRAIRDRLESEPIRFFVEDLEGLLDEARGALGAFIGADPEGIAFVTNATAGVNTVVRSLRFEPGDELLTATQEYNACNNALRHVAEQVGGVGARVVVADPPFPVRNEEEIVQAFVRAVTPRTRLALVSHVTSPTGLVYPIQRIVRELQSRGVDVLVDGAHAPGMVPLNVNSINAAYYTGNCHKWLCAPKGAGFLWVREDRRASIRPLIVSHGANSARTDRSRFRLEFDYTGTADVSAWLCVPEVIRFMATLDPSGWPGVMRRNRELALAARQLLCERLGCEPPAPESMIGSLAAVRIPDRVSTPGVADRPTRYHDPLQDVLIQKHRIQAPIVPYPRETPRRLVRVSAQLYNTPEEVGYLADALVAEVGRVGPTGR